MFGYKGEHLPEFTNLILQTHKKRKPKGEGDFLL